MAKSVIEYYESDFFTNEKIIKTLGINTSTLYRWFKNKDINCYKFGKKKFWKRSEILTYLTNKIKLQKKGCAFKKVEMVLRLKKMNNESLPVGFDFITQKKLCIWLGVKAKDAMLPYRKKGIIKGYRISKNSRRVYFKVSEVHSILESSKLPYNTKGRFFYKKT